jgi:major membrane immunogen (membrane-anchored lipoprotein)
MKLMMTKILNKYGKETLKTLLLIIAISACCSSCRRSAAFDAPLEETQEYTGLMKFYSDTAVTFLENKKSGNMIFSKYSKNNLTGLMLICKDSILFANDTFFTQGKAEHQSFDFIDSGKIVFKTVSIFDGKTVVCKYIFRHDRLSDSWLPDYAEKKESANGQSVYHFTGHFRQDISMGNFSAEQFAVSIFTEENDSVFHYTYMDKNYLDSIVIQVNSMRTANMATFKNIFTVDHAEQILQDYPVNRTNVTLINNMAYYLERMSITMPAIAILETVIAECPDRTVSYLNLSDVLSQNGLNVKAEKIYKQYVNLMKSKGKQSEIQQRIF